MQNPDVPELETFIKAEVDRHADDFKKKRDFNRAMTISVRLLIVLLGVLTTVVLGVKGYLDDVGTERTLSMLALIGSAVTTALTGWENFAGYSTKWVHARQTLGILYNIRDDLKFGSAGASVIPVERLNALYAQLRQQLDVENERWVLTRAPAIAGTNAKR